MAKIDDWKKTAPNTLSIDWAAVEEKLGFTLHDELKNLYSRITAKQVKGFMRFEPKEFVKEYVNRENWLDNANGGRPGCEFDLWSLSGVKTDRVCAFFENAFDNDPNSWTGGNDFGHRALIGELLLNIGQIYLVFNNDSGRFEWVDLEYGYFDVYEDNPYGVIADVAQEFLDKFNIVKI